MSKIVQSFWITVFCGAIGAASTLGFSFLMAPQWEVVGMLRIGSVSGEPIESVAEFVERLRSPATITAVAKSMEGVNNEVSDKYLQSATRVSVVGSGIQLRVRATSQTLAQKLAEQYLLVVRQQQEKMLENQIDALKNFELVIRNNVMPKSPIHSLRLTKFDGTSQLVATYPTEFSVNPVGFSHPVSPARYLMLFLGLMVGVSVGLGYCLSRESSAASSDQFSEIDADKNEK